MTASAKTFRILTIAATALAAVGTAAQAGDWNGRGHGGYRSGGHGGYHAPAPRHYYGHGPVRRDNTGKKIATGVAIGLGAVILGSILADQARRDRAYQRY